MSTLPHQGVERPGLGPATTERFRSCGLVIAALAVWLAFAVPVLRGQIYTSDDLWAFHLPVRAFYAECLQRGDTFDWMPSLFAGFYLSGEGQAGTYHPLHWLLYRWLPLPTAFGLELLLAYPVMFGGMYAMLRRQMLQRDAALFGSLVFTFGSFNTLHFVHPNAIQVIAHLPWLLFAVDVLCTHAQQHSIKPSSRDWRWVAAQVALALLVASQILLGYPQYVWFSLLAIVAFLAWRTREIPGRYRVQITLRVAIALGLGLGLAAVQFLPTVDVLANSSRQSAAATFYHNGDLHPINLLQLGSPYLFSGRVAGGNTHELGFYLGAAPLLLLIWALTQWSRLGTLRPLATAALVFAAVAFLLALGHIGGLYKIQTWLPVVGKFRLPARYVVLSQLGLSVAAACAWNAFFSSKRNSAAAAGEARSPTPVVLRRVIVFFAALALLAHWIWGDERVSHLALRLTGPALLAGALVLLTVAPSRRWAIAALIGFTAADLAVYGGSYAIWRNTFSWPTAVAILRGPAEALPVQRLATDLPVPEGAPPRLRTGDQLTLAGWRQVDGYAGLEPSRYLDYRQPAALRAAGVHWVHSRDEAPPGLQRAEGDWWQVSEPLPRAALLAEVIPTHDPARDIARVDLARIALVDAHQDIAQVLATLPSHQANAENQNDQQSEPESAYCRWQEDRPGRLVLTTSSPEPRFLVINERFHSGWKASLNGQPTTLIRANGEFLGCVIPPGDHRVRLEFDPASPRWGKRISLFSLLLLLIVAGWNFGQARWACKERICK